MSKMLGVDVKKQRDLENNRSLPDSELIWNMYQMFDLSPAIILKDKNCLVNEICSLVEEMNPEIRIKVLSIIKDLYAK